jgi:osmoprotectant transport system ATP-binding protein
MFELRGVSKLFGDVAALRGIDLTVTPGRTIVLIGPSGCGKSTILRLMAGLIQPTDGRVLFDGEDLATADLLPLRRRMGYVIQEGGLFPHLSAARNASLVAGYLGWDQGRITDRLADLADRVRLPPALLDRLPMELSGGQRQRVGLMRALMLDPAVLLLDEPLGSLDPIVRHELQTDLKEVFSRLGKTVVLVTHDLNEAAYFGDEVVLLRDGQIVQRGTPAALLESPRDDFARRFVNAQRPVTAAEGGR